MSQLNELDIQANLAFAAYANLSIGVPNKQALLDVKMTDTQAADFVSKWTVAAQYTDASGTAATVFQENATGKKYLAIRGTESPGDFNADYILALGFPSYLNPQFIQLRAQVGTWISNGTLTSGFTIAGHSLGGYLAAAIGTWFYGQPGEIYLYNAPGIGGPIGNALDAFRAAFGFSDTALVPGITSIRGSAGVSLISGLGAQLAPPQFIETKSSLNPIDNHSIVGLTDSLALYNLFAKVDSAISVDTITTILQASSNSTANILESALTALGGIYGKNYFSGQTTRDIFYTNLYDLQASIGTGGTVVSLTNQSATDLAAQAQTDIAYRYALNELNPFAILGADYSQHNTDGALDLYDPATGSGNLTDLYLQDRAAMLSWKIKFDTGQKDEDDLILLADKPYSDDWHTSKIKDDWKFIDTGGAAADHLYGGAGNDQMFGREKCMAANDQYMKKVA